MWALTVVLVLFLCLLTLCFFFFLQEKLLVVYKGYGVGCLPVSSFRFLKKEIYCLVSCGVSDDNFSHAFVKTLGGTIPSLSAYFPSISGQTSEGFFHSFA